MLLCIYFFSKRFGLQIVLLFIALFYTLLFILAYIGQEYLIYLPVRAIKYLPKNLGIYYEEIELKTIDAVKISAWYIPGEKLKPVVLFCHGNASNISDLIHLKIMYILYSIGFSILIFDYRGFGKSTGKINERGTYKDVEAAWNYLLENKKVASEDVVIWGRSLGGGVASYLASKKNKCKALVLESCFTSIPDLARRLFPFLPVEKIVRHRYPVKEYMPKVRSPVVIMHSKADETVPYAHGKKLYALAMSSKRFIDLEGSHKFAFLKSREKCVAELADFLQLEKNNKKTYSEYSQ